MSSKVVWSILLKLYWIELLQSTADTCSFSFRAHSYAICHDLWTWSKNRNFHHGRHRFFDFQNRSPRKLCGHFRWNSTELQSTMVLQPGGVSSSLLISTPLVMTCQHGPKIMHARNSGCTSIFIRNRNMSTIIPIFIPNSRLIVRTSRERRTTWFSVVIFCYSTLCIEKTEKTEKTFLCLHLAKIRACYRGGGRPSVTKCYRGGGGSKLTKCAHLF